MNRIRRVHPGGLAGITQDRPREAICSVEMIVGQTHEGGGAAGRPIDLRRPAVSHFDDLGRLPHDDMTIEGRETFNTG
jgi:hypothetical protein